jgi:hypothetical protein
MTDIRIELYNNIANGDIKAIDTLLSDWKINDKLEGYGTILEFVCIANEYKKNIGSSLEQNDKKTETIIKALIAKGARSTDCPEYKASFWRRVTGRGGKRKTRRHKSRKSRKSRRR